MDSAYYGFDLHVKTDVNYFLEVILYQIALVETQTGESWVNLKPMRLGNKLENQIIIT